MEKMQELLLQYELSVSGIKKSRGGLIFETPEGTCLLCRTDYGEGRLRRENAIKQVLNERGYYLLDEMLPNAKGNLVTRNMYGEGFVVKRWLYAEECSLRSRSDIRRAAANLGRLHNCLEGAGEQVLRSVQEWEQQEREKRELEQQRKEMQETEGSKAGSSKAEGWETGSSKAVWLQQSPVWVLQKRRRELVHLHRYIHNRKSCNSFELLYLRVYQDMEQQAAQAIHQLKETDVEQRYQSAIAHGDLFHGSYNQHKILFSGKNVMTIDFSHAQTGLGLTDVVHFLRKAMEKNHWNTAIAKELLDSYDRQRSLSKQERQIILSLLAFPEKFWKVANYYNQSRKCWISDRTLKKLEDAIAQQPKRQRFLELMEQL